MSEVKTGEEVEAEWLQLKKPNGEAHVRVAETLLEDDLADLPAACCLMATSNAWDLLFIGGRKNLLVYKLSNVISLLDQGVTGKSIGATPMIEVALEERPQWIRLAMKDKKVLVGMTGESGVKVWDVKNLVQGNKQPLHTFPSAIASLNLLPNPSITGALPHIVLALSPSGITLLDLSSMTIAHTLPGSFTSAAWSVRGKQYVLGLPDGKLEQYAPDGTKKAEIQPPPDVGAALSVNWLDNDTFAVTYAERGDDTQHQQYIVQRDGTYTQLDILFPFGMDRSGGHRELANIRNWGEIKHLTFLTAPNCPDVAVVAKTGTEWSILNLDETSKASVPLTEEESGDAICLGLEIDLTSQTPIKRPMAGGIEQSDLPPAPRLLEYTSDGLLIVYDVLNSKDGEYDAMVKAGDITQAADADEMKEPVNEEKNVTTAVAATTPFGVVSGAPKPAFGFGGAAKLPSFGAGFGQTTGFGSSSSPSLASTFGSASAFGKPAFGSPSSGTPAFGSSAFGGSAFAKPESTEKEVAKPSVATPAFGQSTFGQSFGASSSSGTPAFGSSAFGASAFAKPQSTVTEAPKPVTTTPGFGQSAFGQTTATSPFGKSAFGQPSTGSAFGAKPPGSSTGSAFGSSSAFGQPPTGSAFGASPAFGQASTGSSFGTSSAFGQPSTASTFGVKPAFGQAPAGSAFGSASTFGQSSPGSAFGATPAFGQSPTAPESAITPSSGQPSTSATSAFEGFGSSGTSLFGAAKPSTPTQAPSAFSGFGGLGDMLESESDLERKPDEKVEAETQEPVKEVAEEEPRAPPAEETVKEVVNEEIPENVNEAANETADENVTETAPETINEKVNKAVSEESTEQAKEQAVEEEASEETKVHREETEKRTEEATKGEGKEEAKKVESTDEAKEEAGEETKEEKEEETKAKEEEEVGEQVETEESSKESPKEAPKQETPKSTPSFIQPSKSGSAFSGFKPLAASQTSTTPASPAFGATSFGASPFGTPSPQSAFGATAFGGAASFGTPSPKSAFGGSAFGQSSAFAAKTPPSEKPALGGFGSFASSKPSTGGFSGFGTSGASVFGKPGVVTETKKAEEPTTSDLDQKKAHPAKTATETSTDNVEASVDDSLEDQPEDEDEESEPYDESEEDVEDEAEAEYSNPYSEDEFEEEIEEEEDQESYEEQESDEEQDLEQEEGPMDGSEEGGTLDKASKSTPPTDDKKPLFSFAKPATASSDAGGTIKPVEPETSKPLKSGFNFSKPAVSSPLSLGTGINAGDAASKSAGDSPFVEKAVPRQPTGFSFGKQDEAKPKSGLSIGTPPPTSATSAPLFGFGSPTTTTVPTAPFSSKAIDDTKKPSATPLFGFGAPTTSERTSTEKPCFGTSDKSASPAFSFDKRSQPVPDNALGGSSSEPSNPPAPAETSPISTPSPVDKSRPPKPNPFGNLRQPTSIPAKSSPLANGASIVPEAVERLPSTPSRLKPSVASMTTPTRPQKQPTPQAVLTGQRGLASQFATVYQSLEQQLKELHVTASTAEIYHSDVRGSPAQLPTAEDVEQAEFWFFSALDVLQEHVGVLEEEVAQAKTEEGELGEKVKAVVAQVYKANNKAEDCSRFLRARQDPEFAKRLRVRQLGPEQTERQQQLRQLTKSVRDRLDKVEAQIAAMKRKVVQERTGRVPIRSSALEKVHNSIHNIDTRLQQSKNEVDNLVTRLKGLDLDQLRRSRMSVEPEVELGAVNVADTASAALNGELAGLQIKRSFFATKRSPLVTKARRAVAA